MSEPLHLGEAVVQQVQLLEVDQGVQALNLGDAVA